MLSTMWLASSTYSAIDRVHVDLGLLGPLVPEVGVVQRYVRAVPRCYETSLWRDAGREMKPWVTRQVTHSSVITGQLAESDAAKEKRDRLHGESADSVQFSSSETET